MNVKDYAQYVVQKHQLAIAIAVIKTKPADITYETYIDSIRNKINETNMDSNLDITICDDDFNISDDFTQCDDQMVTDDDHMKTGDELNKSHDSVTILRNIDLNDLDDPFKTKDDTNDLLDVMTQLDSIEENSAIPMDTSQINFTQQTNFDESQMPINVLASNKDEIVDNVRTICETYVESNHKSSNNIAKVIESRYQHVTEIDKNHSNAKLCHNNKQNEYNSNLNENNAQSDKKKIVKNKINIENNNTDSQQTILYTLQGFTDNTHVSQSQEDFVIAKPHLLNRTTTSSNICNIKENIQNSTGDLMESNKDTFVNIMTQNMYSEQDFENLFGSNNEILDSNTNSAKNKDTTQDYQNLDVNKVNEITILYLDKDGQRKHKSVESDSHNDNKRLRIEVNENFNTKNDINSSKYTEFSQFSKNQSNIPSSASLGKNAEDNLAIYSQNNDKNNFDETRNRNKGIAETNSINNYLTQDFALLDKYSNVPESSLDFNKDRSNTINFDINTPDDFENQFSPPESQSLFLSNLYDKILLDTHESDIDNDLNLSQLEKDLYKNKQSHNLLNKNSINIDEPIINLSQNVRNVTNYKVDIEDKRRDCASNNDKLESKVILNTVPNDETEKVTSHNEIINECISSENTQKGVLENDMSNNETDKIEIVSFKTLEALNIVKCYLNRRERWLSEGVNSLDSGFKSSQARSSILSASQSSDVRINESAHGLLRFLTAGQLTDQTAEIADETSKILGKLVDKLHEEEKYPNFLEELLEKVDVLLNDVYGGNNEESNTLLKKNDAIYRLLLLNRSTHIINYSIEKIITVLEKILSDLKEDVLELKHIDKIENVCYIFHILEVILKRVKKSNESSQMSVQSSLDDDRLLKKSSLTEIWRKKWNLTKNEIIEGSAKKKCVLTKCSDVLNQIIVQAMDGYSLVSFAALQCFNLLQK